MKRTPETQEPPITVLEAEAPQPDPTILRQQELQQQYKQANSRIMELRQQETLVRDMITDATMQAAEIRGAIKELNRQQQKG